MFDLQQALNCKIIALCILYANHVWDISFDVTIWGLWFYTTLLWLAINFSLSFAYSNSINALMNIIELMPQFKDQEINILQFFSYGERMEN